MAIDIHTLAIISAIINWVQVIALFIQYRLDNKTHDGPGWWVLGNAIWSAAALFNFLRDNPTIGWFAIIANNALFVSALVLIYTGVQRFMGRRVNRLGLTILCILVTVIAAQFTLIDNDLIIRRINISLALAIISFIIARGLFLYRVRSITASAHFLALVFLFNSLFFVLRALSPILGGPIGEMFSDTLVQTTTYLETLIISTLWTFGFIIMINQRQTVENREAKDHFEMIFKTSPDAYLLVQDGVFTSCNRATELMLGGTSEQIVGRPPAYFSPEFQPDGKKSGEAADEKIRQAFETGSIRFEWVHRRLDGSLFDVEVSIAPMVLANQQVLLTIWRDITERKHAESALHESQIFLSNLIQNNGALIYAKDEQGRYSLVNKKWEQTTGLTRENALNKTDEELFPPQVGQQFREMDLKVIKDGEVQESEEVLENENGNRYFITIKYPLKDDNGSIHGICGISTDITERKKIEEALRESEQNYRTLADSGQALVWLSGTDKLCYYFNTVWLNFTGRTHEQEYGNGWAEGVHPDDFQYCLKNYIEAFDQRQDFKMEYRLRRHDGEYRWLLDEGSPRYDSKGDFIGYVGHCLDITERKQLEDMLRQQASSDMLTGAPNRRHFLELAHNEMKRALRHSHPMSIVLIDIDHFKYINDSFGHAAGDQALVMFAQICQKNIREIDIFARFGGDEFALLMPETNAAQALVVMERIRQSVSAQPLEIDDVILSVITPSAGIASLSTDDETMDMLLERADQALYKAKEAGRNRVMVV
jgi:diguanylate cyclase (GGDEF)-like protein/PAS domain S-box-containing protein